MRVCAGDVMSRVKSTTVFKYGELTAEAQERARDWYREGNASDNFFAESVTDDFKEVLRACGFSLGMRQLRDRLFWSGFGSQGDGASFDASWYASDVGVSALITDRPVTYMRDGSVQETCPHNARLVPILQRMGTLAAADLSASGECAASSRGHCMTSTYRTDCEDTTPGELEHRQDEFSDLCRDLAAFFYWSLETEWEYINSDATVAESIEANEYEFTKDGRIA